MLSHLKCTVVIVDDNRDAANCLEILLKLCGVETRVAYNARAALEMVRESPPHFVLMDIQMPGLDGYSAARLLREDRALDDVVLVAMTGWVRKEDRQRALDAGFDYHLAKPAELKDLEEVLTRGRVRAVS